jgi:hypothetical protein
MPDMRHAPPRRLRIADRESGLNQVSVRSHNERLVLSLLLQREGLSRMEIGQISGLSAQTVSVIVRSLEAEGLILQGEAQRGRMGPPTIPLRLNPEGAFSVGISIGYRKTEVVLIDFVGIVRARVAFTYSDPNLFDIHARLPDLVQQMVAATPAQHHNRIAGIGLAVPSDVDAWDDAKAQPGRNFMGIETELTQLTGLEVLVQNDTTAAASAEGLFGAAKELDDYLYLFLGARLHQRLVLNHQIHAGQVELPATGREIGVLTLENRLLEAGLPVDALWNGSEDWSGYTAFLSPWLDDAASDILLSVEEAMRLVRLQTVVIASSIPVPILVLLHSRLLAALPQVTVLLSHVAHSAKAVGAASLPFSSRFTI